MSKKKKNGKTSLASYIHNPVNNNNYLTKITIHFHTFSMPEDQKFKTIGTTDISVLVVGRNIKKRHPVEVNEFMNYIFVHITIHFLQGHEHCGQNKYLLAYV